MREACTVDFAEQGRELFEEDPREVRVFLVGADYVGRGGEGICELR